MGRDFVNNSANRGSKHLHQGFPGRCHTSAFLILLILLSISVLAACGGGSGGSSGSTGAVSALTLPDRIEMTQVDDSGATGDLYQTSAFSAALFSDAETDYANQTKESWVDDGNEALVMVNDILGACRQTAYGQFVNQGPYKALVKPVGEHETGQTGATTTATTTESLMEMTVNVTRASNDAPMYVDVWVEEDDGPGGGAMLIRGRFIVSQGVSADYPFGVMEAHFKGNAYADGVLGAVMFTMAMQIDADTGGQVVVQYVENATEGGSFQRDTAAKIVTDAAFTAGNAYTYLYESDGNGAREEESYVAFDDAYLKKEIVGGVVKVYDKADFDRRIYRYKLFAEDTGDLVELTSGFPIELRDADGFSDGHGYVGYYGLWTPGDVALQNGDTVYKMDSDDAYQVFKVAGKLIKHTRQSVTLNELADVEMAKWECSAQTCNDIVIAWDAVDERFEKIGERSEATNWNTDYDIVDAGTVVTFANDWDNAWCEALKANFQMGQLYAAGQPTPANSTAIYYYAEEVITPGTAGVAPTTFYYWGPGIGEDWSGPPTKKTYTWDPAAMLLKEGATPLLDAGSSNQDYGTHMSPLMATDTYSDTDWWQAYQAAEYYSWQTGADEWNQFTTIKRLSDDTYVDFDPPIRLNYTHTNANDVNWESGDPDVNGNGKMFNVEWDGFELRIPWEFDPNRNEWSPMFNLADGVLMTGNGTNYRVKATEESLLMRQVDETVYGTDLTPDPTVDSVTLAWNASVADAVADPSTVADAELLVIKGELIGVQPE